MTLPQRRPPRSSTLDLPRPRLVPRGRQALVTELMRLEHMRARVERELAAWAEKEDRAQARLVQITARLDIIYAAVADLHAKSRTLTVLPGGRVGPVDDTVDVAVEPGRRPRGVAAARR